MIVNGERELAYVVEVTDVKPMDADRLECVQINGWNCVCGKGDFKKGDLGIFFEIDSKLPEVKPFTDMEFLVSKHFKIKSQKIRGVISQGLLIPLTTEGLNLTEAQMKLNTPLTKVLNVTYAVSEDNRRKAKDLSKQKYNAMAARHKELFKHQPFRWLMRREWGRVLLFMFFGKKRDTPLRFPTHFEFVHKTDEERCLLGQTKIKTDIGNIQISHIVNDKLPVKVLSYNLSTQKLEYKPIVGYQKIINDSELVTIKYPYIPGTARTNSLCCTNDHKILTQRGYVPASELTLNDKLIQTDVHYNEGVLEAIYGMLLGDSHIYNDRRTNGKIRVVATNGEDQLDYLNYKKNLFNNDGKIVKSGIGSFSFKPTYHYFLNVDSVIDYYCKKDWLINNKKTVTQSVIDRLSPVSLAFWYMDDGCLSYRDANGKSPCIRLNTQGFSFEENQLLQSGLYNKFNIKSTLEKDKKYYLLRLSNESVEYFLRMVTPYMCKSMAYKTLPKFENLLETQELRYHKVNNIIEVPILEISNGQNKLLKISKNPKYVYDITVEDNHNFFADGVLTHNCENMPWILENKDPWIKTCKVDGTSSTYILERKPFGKNEYYVTSRNVRQRTPDQKNFHNDFGVEGNVYWEMSDKYHIQEFLQKMLDNNKDWKYVCLQGEIAGPDIQKNPHGLKEVQFFGFNFIDSVSGRWNSVEACNLCYENGIPWVPIVDIEYILPDDFEEFKKSADGPCDIIGSTGMREGFVYRSKDGTQSFKNVSREYLLKHNG